MIEHDRKFMNPTTGFIVVSFSNIAAGVVAALLRRRPPL